MRAAAGLVPSLRLAGVRRVDLGAVGAFALPFTLVVYLALKGGGYDTILRSEVGIAVWWIVLLGALVGVLPIAQIGWRGWVAFGALAGFAAWTALGIGWSESTERSVTELGRVATYLGVFALALLVCGRERIRAFLNGLTSAVALVAALALLSRLHPGWFPDNEVASFLPERANRLTYPFNYWNALAAFVVLGLPLVLGATSSARTVLGQAFAAAALPMMALTAFLTFSRGGALAAAVGIAVFFCLAPDRLPKLGSLAAAGAGAAILIVAATQRSALENGAVTAAARHQGDEMLAMVVLVCAGVGLVQAGLSLAVRYGIRPSWLAISPRRAGAVLASMLVAGAVAAAVADAPHGLADRWREFKNPNLLGTLAPGQELGVGRYESASGNGRYQHWQSALDANAAHPLRGIGPGTFEFWWAREGSLPWFVRDAHSLYIETLGELGLIGLLLIGGFFLWVLASAIARTLGARASPVDRVRLAAATAACAAFSVSASIDWVWEVGALPVAFLLLAAVVLARRSGTDDPSSVGRGPIVARSAIVVLSLGALVAIAIPLAAASAMRRSREDAAGGHLAAALADARTAARIQPYAATPKLQRALLLEVRGDLDEAAGAAAAATRDERTNWRLWLVLSRIQAERGHAAASVRAYRKAKSLNRLSPLFSP